MARLNACQSYQSKLPGKKMCRVPASELFMNILMKTFDFINFFLIRSIESKNK
jgi:hypothetical protein